MSEDATAPADAFAALGEETRVAILRALAEHRREAEGDPELSFSALRERVGMRDSGQFNYHLGKLRGRFVERTEDGYGLTYAGREVVGAILAGTYEGASVGPTSVDGACTVCGAGLTGEYDDGIVTVTCDADHTVFRAQVPPGAAADRSMPDLLSFATRLTYADFELLTAGICPECYGAVDGSIGPMDADGESDIEWAYRTTCQRCGVATTSMAGLALLHDAAFLGFCADHGVALHERLPWALPLDAPVERTSEAPPRFRVPVVMDDERFGATLSGTGEVLQTGREPIS